MAAAAEPSNQECPVCHDDYTKPKILRCAHIVCRKCVISWLGKEGNQGGCPLCRAPILPASSDGQGDLGSAVDALPTDLMVAAAVESQRILNSPNRCVCDDSTEAKFLCLQCRIKLCNSCAKSHLKSPICQLHTVKDLSDISAEKLAGFQHSSCSRHDDETAILFCRSHAELICLLCITSDHRQCVDVGGIKEEAKVQREELEKQLERFMEKEKDVAKKIEELDRQIADGKAKFQEMRAEIKATFEDLRKRLDAQYEKMSKDLDEKEEAYLADKNTPKADLASYRAGLGAHAHIMGKVVSASDNFLLDIQSKMRSHLHQLESQEHKYKETEVGSISLDDKLVTDLKSLICKLGEVGLQIKISGLGGPEFAAVLKVGDRVRRGRDWPLGWNEVGLQITGSGQSGLGGPEFAAIMKVGDRVRRGRDWIFGNSDGNPPGLGTISEVHGDGMVSVMWDCGPSYPYCMGYKNKYRLQLA